MLISRRVALVRGVAMVAGAHKATSPQTAAPGVSYRLKAGPHCSCKACHSHAANRLFATHAAADQGRAHPGCNCKVVRSSVVDPVQWKALFGNARRLSHKSVDRRWASTKHALKQAARAQKAAARAQKTTRRRSPAR
jgi:hypothetical protein